MPPPPSARSLRQARRRDKPAEIQSQLSPRKAVAKPARPAGELAAVPHVATSLSDASGACNCLSSAFPGLFCSGGEGMSELNE